MQDFSRPTSLPAIQEARRLLSQQSDVSSKVNLVMNELTNTYDELVPFLRSIATGLSSSHSTVKRERERERKVSQEIVAHSFDIIDRTISYSKTLKNNSDIKFGASLLGIHLIK